MLADVVVNPDPPDEVLLVADTPDVLHHPDEVIVARPLTPQRVLMRQLLVLLRRSRLPRMREEQLHSDRLFLWIFGLRTAGVPFSNELRFFFGLTIPFCATTPQRAQDLLRFRNAITRLD